MLHRSLRAGLVGLAMMPLTGCAALWVADTAVDATVFAGATVVRGAAATGRIVTGGGREECEDGERRRRCD